MRVAKVIGTVTLSAAHESLRGGSYRIVVPQSLANLSGTDLTEAEELIAYDELGSACKVTSPSAKGAKQHNRLSLTTNRLMRIVRRFWIRL